MLDSTASAAGAERPAPDPSAIAEIDILWLTAGLGCDGDTIAMTAATQPSIEDLLDGALPWIPKVTLRHPFLDFENGDAFLRHFHAAAEGTSGPFILVIEGSIPDETNKAEGYWATFGTDASTGRPITTCDWIDRLAPKAWAVVAAGTCAAYGGIHAMEGNPTGAMGLPDYLGWTWESRRSARWPARMSAPAACSSAPKRSSRSSSCRCTACCVRSVHSVILHERAGLAPHGDRPVS